MKMKKTMVFALSALVALGTATSAAAGAFENYNDYQNADGSYSYYFEQGVMKGIVVTMDEEWYQNTRVKIEDGGASFYHKDSYNAFEAEGQEGGRLFTIGASVDSSFSELPDFIYIGFDEDLAMNYYADLPTDFQAYPDGGEIEEEYKRLYAGVEDIIAGIEIMGQEEEEPEETEEPVPPMVGGWSVVQDDTVTEETQAIFDKALEEIDGVAYEPVLLMATQVVSGTNYCFLARGAAVVPDPAPYYAFVYIYQDLQGNVELMDIQEIQFEF